MASYKVQNPDNPSMGWTAYSRDTTPQERVTDAFNDVDHQALGMSPDAYANLKQHFADTASRMPQYSGVKSGN